MNTNKIISELNKVYRVDFINSINPIHFYYINNGLEASIIDIHQTIKELIEQNKQYYKFLPINTEQYRKQLFNLILFYIDMYIEYNYKVHKGLNNNIIL